MAQYTYALIDGVMRQTAIKDLYQSKQPIQVIPLYMGTRFQDNYDLGPILLAVAEGYHLIDQIQQDWSNSTTLIQSDQYLATVAAHLKQLITVTDQTASHCLFRFADPLTTWHWLTSYSSDNYPDLLGPISSWQIKHPIPNYFQQQTHQWDQFNNPATAKKGIVINKLSPIQEQALDNAYLFRLKEKLYQAITSSYPHFFDNAQDQQIDQWLTNRIQAAKDFYLISEQAIAMWLILCCEQGNYFAQDQQGAYQQWLTAHPEQKKLPSEVTIQHFFNERPSANNNINMEI